MQRSSTWWKCSWSSSCSCSGFWSSKYSGKDGVTFIYNLLSFHQSFLTDKLSRLLPYQPVYSKEMSEKIKIEEEKLRSGNSFDIKCASGEYSISSQVFDTLIFDFPKFDSNIPEIIFKVMSWSEENLTNLYAQHPLFGCVNTSSCYPLDTMVKVRTNSTFLLKQPNSFEVDRSQLRKTKSAENMFRAPTIVIDQVLYCQAQLSPNWSFSFGWD